MLSNDSMEGRLTTKKFLELVDQHLTSPYTAKIRGMLEVFSDLDGLGFCLSTEGDLLSQWRAYADDGHGISIGFSDEYLEELSEISKKEDEVGFLLNQVEYDTIIHQAAVDAQFLKVKELIASGALTFDTLLKGSNQEALDKRKSEVQRNYEQMFYWFMKFIITTSFVHKSKAFGEEKEWRLLSLHMRQHDKCFYRPIRNKLLPYRNVPLRILSNPAIIEVILGPKHATPTSVIKSFLGANGFNDVIVKCSEATYR